MSRTRAITRRELITRVEMGLAGGIIAGVLGSCTSALSTAVQPTPTVLLGGASTLGPAPTSALAPTSGPVAAPTSTSMSTVATLIPTRGPSPTIAASPRQGGTLRFGNVGDFVSLEGQTLRVEILDHLYSVWDQLVFLDSNHQPQPMLAESWEIADNFQQITFNLRHGVQFHTSRELTAEDVKFSLLRIQDPKTGSTFIGRMAPMIGVETPDKYTVVVKASRPWVEAFDTFQLANIIDPVTYQAAGLSIPTGTGPFKFVEYAQGDHLRLVKNPNYWRSGLPYMDEVLISIHRDAQAAVVALEAGGLDLISVGLPLSDMVRLQTDPKYQVLLDVGTGSSWVAYLNCTRPPTDDKLVRQALNYALDRRRMADTIWHGLEMPIVLPWSSASAGYDAVKNGAYAYDLDKARSLLRQAGVTNTQLDIVWSVGPPEYATLAQIYQADLATLGFQVTLRPLEAGAFLPTVNSFNYHGVRLGQYMAAFNPATSAQGGLGTQFAGFQDDAYTQLADQVVTATEPAAQRQLYSQLNDYFIDQSWALPIVPNPEHAAATANVHGLRYDARPGLVTAEIWLA